MNNNILLKLRKEILSLDENILKLLKERKKLVIKVAKEKIKTNKPIRDIKREKELIDHLISISNSYKLDNNYINLIFRVIIDYSIFIQNKLIKKSLIKKNISRKKLAISFLGPKCSYSHHAAKIYADKNFKKYTEVSCNNFKEVILCVENHLTDVAILPIENSNSGSINEVYDLLHKTDLSIIGEFFLPIKHCVLSRKNIDLTKIKKVYSHPQLFQQCSDFIDLFPQWKIEYTKSTASAMQIVSEKNKENIVALGSEEAGNFYNLKVLKYNISNYKKNFTRFIILSLTPIIVPKKEKAKTSLIIKTNQNFSSLTETLLIIREYDLNISKLESRPCGSSWQEIFYIDIIGNLYSYNVQQAINKIYIVTKSLKIIGCYPIYNNISV